ncbi:Gfo/Idh/MocA family protein [Methanogenium sp. MK-MG]|uniref:Gfo/Idh/MocA family protein n=1 Tax=Methanogenium sp. MK-MG TaxID=2599926 RepID=UPI0013EBB391|nr:Gfo/Idh/MocA family oxidoreductase [Methanogenium sp. MK-MG]KAF1078999.1 UDP-N-acetylglucosamine 3-dehydrogenase [Methanogenium sp. MK-MG]
MDVGVIGVGVMGQNHARVYSELKAVDSVRVFDLNETAAQNVAAKNGIECAGSMEELLRSVDAVSLCVPTPYHYTTAKAVIDAGVHMLIEKPICLTSQEAEDLIPQIPDDLVVGVGHIERFNPIIAEIQRIVKDPLYVEIKRHNPASARVTGSSVVEDLMIHDIDIVFNALFDGEYSMQSFCTFDICGAMFQFEKTPVYLSASRKSSKKMRMIHIEEEEFTIQGDFMTQEVYVYRKPEHYHVEEQRYVQDNIIEKVMVGKVEPLKTELNTFIDCVKKGNPFTVTPEQGLANVRVCESIKNEIS